MIKQMERQREKCAARKRIVVAVHGIGDQVRNATAQSVARIFGAGSIPLGRFPENIEEKVDGATPSIDPVSECNQRLWDFRDNDWRMGWFEAGTGFAEVFWADIPRTVASEGYTIQETKAWGATVVDRLRSRDHFQIEGDGVVGQTVERCRRVLGRSDTESPEVDYDKAAAALTEFVDGVRLVETLGKIGGKFGLPTFDAGKVLNDYVNDVQVVAEYPNLREHILLRFIRTLRKVARDNPDAEIHVVAHSEGTVVAVLGLLHTFCGTPLYQRSCRETTESGLEDIARMTAEEIEKGRAWLRQVKGFLTIGSPIDKHVVMWPELWEEREIPQKPAHRFRLASPIRWFNYSDKGDPVGYKLETARELFKGNEWANEAKVNGVPLFCFPEENDCCFTRYPLPGKAHNDYFQDEDVFRHYSESMYPEKGWSRPPGTTAPVPRTRTGAWIVSRICPYVLILLVLGTGVWLVHKAVLDFTLAAVDAPPGASLAQLPVDPSNTWQNVIGITLLVAGVTLVTRLARLTRGRKIWFAGWHGMGLVLFVVSATGFQALVTGTHNGVPGLREVMGQGIVGWLGTGANALIPALRLTGIIVVVLLAVGVASLLKVPELKRRRLQPDAIVAGIFFVGWLTWLGFLDRGRFSGHAVVLGATGLAGVCWIMAYCMPRAGVFPLLLTGAALMALSIAGCLQNLPDQAEGTTAGPSLWPVITGGLGFLYLWWLATLLFDLVFIWHRYIMGNEAHRQLKRLFCAERNIPRTACEQKRALTR